MKDGKIRILVLLMFMVPAFMFAQDVVVLTPSDGSAGTFVNEQIVADTTATGGLLPNRVYELQRDQLYLVNATLRLAQPGETLRIRAQDGAGALPEVYLWPTGTGDNPERPPGYFIRTQGGDLELTNLAIAGYYEYDPANLDNVQGGFFRNDVEGASFYFDGCIFSNINGQILRTQANTVTVSITDCIFSNLGSLTTSNLGAGKGIDLREKECGEFIMENNTFVNYQDRVVRHYNYGDPLAGTGLIHSGRINHNTIVNGMGFHGLLSLGNVGASMQITNNLFVDAFGLGEDSTDATRAAEWANVGETYTNGNNKISWIFCAPNDVTQWDISNNYFAISDSGQAFLDDFDFGPAPCLSSHIDSALGAAAATAFTKIDVELAEIPQMMTNFMRWYEDPAGGNKTKVTDNYDKTTDDMDRRTIIYYRDTLDCAYPTSSEAYIGAEMGYPAGDLNWFPDLKEQWEGGTAPLTFAIDGNKDAFYEQLTGPDDGYLQLRYYAWNDNGEPDNDADLSAKMWFAWDNNWLYFYEEVKDDIISMSSTNTYNNDGFEIKVDPQATDSVANSIVGKEMTALDTTGGITGVATLANSFRKTTADGYVIEAAIPWTDLATTTESVDVGVGNVFGCAVQNHDNDNTTGTRDASVQWAAVLKDAVWNTPKYCGTVKFLADNKLQFIPSNNMTGVTNEIPYDGSDYERTAVSKTAVPYVYALNQNYPNPFNPTTKITFSLEKAEYTTLTVYNMIGQKVAVPFAGKLGAGKHEITFNASKLTSGVYFYKLESGEHKSIKKMLLMK